jgi:signal transduction histidine kinase
MTTVSGTLRVASTWADTAVGCQQDVEETTGPETDQLRTLTADACRILSTIGALRTCVLLLRDDGRDGLTPVAARGANPDRLVGLLTRPDVAGALTHALATERTTTTERGRFVVVPLVADDTVVGAVLGRRNRRAPALGLAACHALTTSGQLTALAVRAHRAALRDERARHRRARLELARELHETVVQRLFAASLVLSASGPLQPDEQRCCAEALQVALAELRAGLLNAARPDADAAPRLAEDLVALRDVPGVHVSVTGPSPRLAAHQDAATRSVLAEAVRNARKHAGDAPIHVAVHTDRDLLTLDVVNAADPPGAAGHVPGVGLELAAAEVLEVDGLLGHGRTPTGQWRVQLTVPHPGALR